MRRYRTRGRLLPRAAIALCAALVASTALAPPATASEPPGVVLPVNDWIPVPTLDWLDQVATDGPPDENNRDAEERSYFCGFGVVCFMKVRVDGGFVDAWAYGHTPDGQFVVGSASTYCDADECRFRVTATPSSNVYVDVVGVSANNYVVVTDHGCGNGT